MTERIIVGLFDDVGSLVGRSLDAADKKAQFVKAQTQLAHIDKKKDGILLELGKSVLLDMGNDSRFVSKYARQLKEIAELESQAAEINRRIKELEAGSANLVSDRVVQAAVAHIPEVSCPRCNSPINLSDSFCPSCGEGMESIKAELMKCPKCNRVCETSVRFCELCGSKTVPFAEPAQEKPLHENVEIVSTLVEASTATTFEKHEPNHDSDTAFEQINSVGEVPVVPVHPRCLTCGAQVEVGAAFCGLCGTPLN